MSVAQRDVARHLMTCVDALYRHGGEAAPRFTKDAYVVRAYEGARHFGDLALAWREELAGEGPASFALLDAVLAKAIAADETGAMSLYALVAVVGPRLLVSVRDAREVLTSARLRTLVDATADVTVQEILRVGSTMRRASGEPDEVWQQNARALSDTLERAGFVESLGIQA